MTRDIICDIDGTLGDASWRQHYVRTNPKNWKAFNESMKDDPPQNDIIWLVQTLKNAGNRIVLCSGREEVYREVTEKWLLKYLVPYDALYMRPKKDYRDDSVIKLELLDQMRADGYDPTIALDDRDRVVDAWRVAGLRCLQVAPGDF